MGENKTTYYFFSFSCGMVDAICFAKLGGVFISLMTGNMILLGLGIGQRHPVETYYPFLIPLVFYGLGTYVGGWITANFPGIKSRKLAFCLVWQLLFISALMSARIEYPAHGVSLFLLLVTLGLSAGLQTALLQKSGLKNFASNVMTSTFTSMLVDFPGKSEQPKALLSGRFLSILFFLLGTISGAVAVDLGVTAALFLSMVPLTIAVMGVITESNLVE
jgi:uncharacterized membrane protein YoaK (UPF0700 family)